MKPTTADGVSATGVPTATAASQHKPEAPDSGAMGQLSIHPWLMIVATTMASAIYFNL
ncbi:hypothetical protein F4678DRAFT_421808 [Xylaria arbuscula]|nr:hypothetical protein F4678DRAFT_421808 [Xylaria arbuscula]